MPNKFLQIIALLLPLPSFKLFLNPFGTHVITFQGQKLCNAFTFQQSHKCIHVPTELKPSDKINFCCCSGGSRGDPGVRANPPLDPC